MTSPVNQAVIQFVSREVRGSWRELGRELDVKDTVVSNIEVEVNESGHEHPLYEGCCRMLSRWKEYFGKDATIKVLITKLTECGLDATAKDLLENLSVDAKGD